MNLDLREGGLDVRFNLLSIFQKRYLESGVDSAVLHSLNFGAEVRNAAGANDGFDEMVEGDEGALPQLRHLVCKLCQMSEIWRCR